MNGTNRTVLVLCAGCMLSASASAQSLPASEVMPPWSEPGDVPLAPSLRSAVVTVRESALYREPDMKERRGSLARGARVPVFAAQRAPNCRGRFLLVGPSAWLCSDEVTLSSEPYVAPKARPVLQSGLPYDYYFVRAEWASAYASFEGAGDAAPEGELQRGFYLPIVEVREKLGARYGRTRAGQWLDMADLTKARPLAFQGEHVESAADLDFGWVRIDKAQLKPADAAGRARTIAVPRFTKVKLLSAPEPVKGRGAPPPWQVELPDGTRGSLPQSALSVPRWSSPPAEVREGERWIDIDLPSQTLIAYHGAEPAYATLVSTGRGAQGTDTATPIGLSRVWVKLHTSTMGNLERDDAESSYSIADVPYVQFFHRGVALHAAFWHRDFGHIHSHGCVNLTPEDALLLFQFTAPHLPAGWDAVLPTPQDPGTWIRVR